MRPMSKLLLVLAAVAMGCTTVATTVAPDQRSIPAGSGIVLGRLGFVAKKKMNLQSFHLAAVQVPDGDRYWIHARLDGEAEEAGSFFVNLPPGHYRLTEWTASAGSTEWAGEDAGLAIEVMPGEAVCVGALYLHPRERQMFRLEQAEDPPTLVRDECGALGELLHQRSPSLSRAALVKVAQPVSRRRS
jgi:hypothetical protein